MRGWVGRQLQVRSVPLEICGHQSRRGKIMTDHSEISYSSNCLLYNKNGSVTLSMNSPRESVAGSSWRLFFFFLPNERTGVQGFVEKGQLYCCPFYWLHLLVRLPQRGCCSGELLPLSKSKQILALGKGRENPDASGSE